MSNSYPPEMDEKSKKFNKAYAFMQTQKFQLERKLELFENLDIEDDYTCNAVLEMTEDKEKLKAFVTEWMTKGKIDPKFKFRTSRTSYGHLRSATQNSDKLPIIGTGHLAGPPVQAMPALKAQVLHSATMNHQERFENPDSHYTQSPNTDSSSECSGYVRNENFTGTANQYSGNSSVGSAQEANMGAAYQSVQHPMPPQAAHIQYNQMMMYQQVPPGAYHPSMSFPQHPAQYMPQQDFRMHQAPSHHHMANGNNMLGGGPPPPANYYNGPRIQNFHQWNEMNRRNRPTKSVNRKNNTPAQNQAKGNNKMANSAKQYSSGSMNVNFSTSGDQIPVQTSLQEVVSETREEDQITINGTPILAQVENIHSSNSGGQIAVQTSLQEVVSESRDESQITINGTHTLEQVEQPIQQNIQIEENLLETVKKSMVVLSDTTVSASNLLVGNQSFPMEKSDESVRDSSENDNEENVTSNGIAMITSIEDVLASDETSNAAVNNDEQTKHAPVQDDTGVLPNTTVSTSNVFVGSDSFIIEEVIKAMTANDTKGNGTSSRISTIASNEVRVSSKEAICTVVNKENTEEEIKQVPSLSESRKETVMSTPVQTQKTKCQKNETGPRNPPKQKNPLCTEMSCVSNKKPATSQNDRFITEPKNEVSPHHIPLEERTEVVITGLLYNPIAQDMNIPVKSEETPNNGDVFPDNKKKKNKKEKSNKTKSNSNPKKEKSIEEILKELDDEDELRKEMNREKGKVETESAPVEPPQPPKPRRTIKQMREEKRINSQSMTDCARNVTNTIQEETGFEAFVSPHMVKQKDQLVLGLQQFIEDAEDLQANGTPVPYWPDCPISDNTKDLKEVEKIVESSKAIIQMRIQQCQFVRQKGFEFQMLMYCVLSEADHPCLVPIFQLLNNTTDDKEEQKIMARLMNIRELKAFLKPIFLKQPGLEQL